MQEARRLLENPRELHGLRNEALDHPRGYRGTRSAEDLDRHQLRNLVGAATLPDNGLVKILGFFLGDLRALESACAEAELQGLVELSKFVGDRGVDAPVVHDIPAFAGDPAAWTAPIPLEAGDVHPVTEARVLTTMNPSPPPNHREGVPSGQQRLVLGGWAGRARKTTGGILRGGGGGSERVLGVRDPPLRCAVTATPPIPSSSRSGRALVRARSFLHRACTNGGTVTDTRVGEMMLDFLGEEIEIHAAANGGPTVNGIRRCDELEEARDQGLLQIREVAGRVGREVRGKHVRTRDDCAAGGNASWTGRSKGVNEEEPEAAKREAEAAHARAQEEEKAKTAQALRAATNRVEMAKTVKKRRGTGGKIAAGVAFVRTGILFVVHMLLLLFLVVDVDDVDDDDA
ncbi:unnamed protein product [Ectocarpus sp. CCAP 1310/34]|nr:unnamed protein product [Ectocarpus sp. CCAP 1310/34]